MRVLTLRKRDVEIERNWCGGDECWVSITKGWGVEDNYLSSDPRPGECHGGACKPVPEERKAE